MSYWLLYSLSGISILNWFIIRMHPLSTYDFSRITILIVEDNVYIRNTFENLLRSFQFGKIEKANNGEEAIKYLKMMKRN